MSKEADYKSDIESMQFVVQDAQCTYDISFNRLYSAILKKLQDDGVIPICGED